MGEASQAKGGACSGAQFRCGDPPGAVPGGRPMLAWGQNLGCQTQLQPRGHAGVLSNSTPPLLYPSSINQRCLIIRPASGPGCCRAQLRLGGDGLWASVFPSAEWGTHPHTGQV